MTKQLKLLISLTTLFTFWYIAGAMEMISPYFLPPLPSVFKSFARLFTVDFILGDLYYSVVRIVGAFVISAFIGIVLGILFGTRKSISDFIEPVFSFIRYLPVAALVPLSILWFGIGDGQKIAVIVMGVVFQLVLLVSFAVREVPHEMIESGRIMKFSQNRIIFRIIIPYASPAIWDSLRISAGWAWSYLILAELIAGNKGIGYFIIQSQRYFQIENVFAGILYIGLLGLITDNFFKILAPKLFKWK